MSDVQAKTYRGGATLPSLTDDYQAVRVGRNTDGELVPEQRAFVATVRNRSSGEMHIKEGNGDGIRISPGESYVVMRTNGTSRLMLKGATVGADYEVRTVEAHNDFSLTDRVEGFVQSVSALLRSAQTNVRELSAEGLVETDLTQTADVPPGTEQTTVLRADLNEVWELRHMELNVDPIPGAAGEHVIRLETEDQEIELAFGTNGGNGRITYQSGEFTAASSSRVSFSNIRVDASGGVQIVYENGSDTTQTGTREIRLAFRVIQA